MRIFVYFSPDVLEKSGAANLASALKSETSSEFVFTDPEGYKTRMTVADGQVYVRGVEQAADLPESTWKLASSVSLWDDVSDPAMLKQMSSGLYHRLYDDNGLATRATVRLYMNTVCDAAFLQAEIKITAPSWQSAQRLHHEILFGAPPDHPHVKVAPPTA